MLSLIMITLLLDVLNLISLCEAQAVQVGLALRSDPIVLVQLGDHNNINYTIQVDADQDYRDFMATRRHNQTDLLYLHEADLYFQNFLPIYSRTSTHPTYPVTSFHCAHVIARNIRPVIKQAELELGETVKCDAIVVPSDGSGHDFRSFVQLASELAGCGSIGYSQMPGSHRVLLFAHDLDIIDGIRQRHSDSVRTLYSPLIEMEPSHIRIGTINAMATWVKSLCAHSCDREVLSVAEAFLKCVAEFKEHCLLDNEPSLWRRSKVNSNDIKKIFVSGTMGSQQEQIKKLISAQFRREILDDMSFGIDTEILGAYGAARWVRISSEVDYLRDYDTRTYLHSLTRPIMRFRAEGPQVFIVDWEVTQIPYMS